MDNHIKYGQIYYINLSPVVGSEQGGKKPCVIVQNNTGNKFSTTTIVCPITRLCHNKADIPTHRIVVPDDENGLVEPSIILTEQVRAVSKERIVSYFGKLSEKDIDGLKACLKVSLNI